MSRLDVDVPQMVERLGCTFRRCVVAVPAVLLLSLAGPLQAGESEAMATEPEAETDSVVPLISEAEADDGDCVESETVMCLQDGRYEVTVGWTTLSGETGPAKVARPRTRDSGLFYFFSYNNWEVLLKVLDGCAVNQHHWVYAASATDLGLNMVVRDTVTKQEKQYFKNAGSPAPATTDSGAFPDACEA
jgi:hypothetical protein